jgi:hypothetical protein
MSIINGKWFSVSEDSELEVMEENKEREYEKRIKDLEEKVERIKDLEEKVERIKDLEDKIHHLETTCNKIRNENLKLINRVLEAEISIERTKNILLRKNISFPFTPLTTKFL